MVFYGTAAATQSAGVMFFDDVYGYDAMLETALGDASR